MKKIALVFISTLGFFVSLFFSGYTLSLYAGGEVVIAIVFIAFAIVLQGASVLFAVLTTTISKTYLLPTIIMALLNIFATTSFGVSTFAAEYKEDSSGNAYVIERKEQITTLKKDIGDLQKQKNEYPDTWATWKARTQDSIDKKQEKLDGLLSAVYEVKPEEKRDKQTPVTLYLKISKMTGLDPMTIALLYYFLCSVMLEIIVTVFAGVAATLQKEKPEPVEEYVLPYHPEVTKHTVAEYIRLAWPEGIPGEFMPGTHHLDRHDIKESDYDHILKVLFDLGLIKRVGMVMLPTVDKDTALSVIRKARKQLKEEKKAKK